MTDLPLHPIAVHLPLALAVVVPFLALAVALAERRKLLPAATWTLVVALQAVLLIGGIVALRTGEADEEIAEEVVSHRLIHGHEDHAKQMVWWGALPTLVLMTAALLPWLARWRTIAVWMAIIASFVTLGFALETGHHGGELVYRHGAATAHLPDGG